MGELVVGTPVAHVAIPAGVDVIEFDAKLGAGVHHAARHGLIDTHSVAPGVVDHQREVRSAGRPNSGFNPAAAGGSIRRPHRPHSSQGTRSATGTFRQGQDAFGTRPLRRRSCPSRRRPAMSWRPSATSVMRTKPENSMPGVPTAPPFDVLNAHPGNRPLVGRRNERTLEARRDPVAMGAEVRRSARSTLDPPLFKRVPQRPRRGKCQGRLQRQQDRLLASVRNLDTMFDGPAARGRLARSTSVRAMAACT